MQFLYLWKTILIYENDEIGNNSGCLNAFMNNIALLETNPLVFTNKNQKRWENMDRKWNGSMDGQCILPHAAYSVKSLVDEEWDLKMS